MSEWIGPSVYRIENHKDCKAKVRVKDGGKSDGADAVLRYA